MMRRYAEGSREDGPQHAPLPSVHETSVDEAFGRLERARASMKDSWSKSMSLETSCAQVHTEGKLEHDVTADDFFRSNLRLLRASNFEEKLRVGRGEPCIQSSHPHWSEITLQSEHGGSTASQSRPDFVAAVSSALVVEAERDELQWQLLKAQADVARLSDLLETSRRNHQMEIAAVRSESSAQAHKHFVEQESLRKEAAAAVAEASRLQRELAEERKRGAALWLHNGPVDLPANPQAIAPAIASMEVEALRHADTEAHSRLKKKLQLKWHPDKCINATLAKCVMQELQRRPEW
jgi:hypothetical protein